jgi:protein-S-isoprenylcysteine O-methyltransferase Ste14
MNDPSPDLPKRINLRGLLGSGGKIWLFTSPFLAAGLVLNILFPAMFGVGGPGRLLKAVAILLLVPGVALWWWSTGLILTKARRGELITTGPYALLKHPIYTSVGLLVIPSAGFLLDTWLGALVGITLYIGSRRYSPEEETALAKTFGPAWDAYARKVKIPWL